MHFATCTSYYVCGGRRMTSFACVTTGLSRQVSSSYARYHSAGSRGCTARHNVGRNPPATSPIIWAHSRFSQEVGLGVITTVWYIVPNAFFHQCACFRQSFLHSKWKFGLKIISLYCLCGLVFVSVLEAYPSLDFLNPVRPIVAASEPVVVAIS